MEKSNIRKLAAGLCLSASLFIGQSVLADAHLGPPSTFEVQGKLLDADGVVVPDGDYDFSVAIGDDNLEAPTVYWPEQGEELTLSEVGPVSVVDGIYNFTVGPVDPAILTDNSAYLWVFLDGETFGPQDIQSVPYAIVAHTAVSANSVADGSITADSIAAGAISADKFAPGAVEGALLSDGETTLGETIDSVSKLRDVVKPVVDTETLTYTIFADVAINTSNPFGVSGAALTNAIGGGIAPGSAPQVVVSNLPTGLTFNTAGNTLTGTVTAANAGSYPFNITITDFLGQVTTLDATLNVIVAEFTDIEAVISAGDNSGDEPAIGNLFAGDSVEFSFIAYVDKDADPEDLVTVDLSEFTITWETPNGDVSLAGDADGINAFEVAGVKNYTTGFLGNASDLGLYDAEIEMSLGQTIDVPGSFTITEILAGFDVATYTYNGIDVIGQVPAAVDAGNDSPEFVVTLNQEPVNGTAQFIWYTSNDATPAGSGDVLGTVAATIDSDADSSTLILEDVTQGVEGRAVQNNSVVLDPEDDEIYYFPVVDSGFSDAVLLNGGTAAALRFRTNDNVNVAIYPQPRVEFGGYPATFSVVTGTTNGVGDLEFGWWWSREDNDAEFMLDSESNSQVIPAENMISLVDDPADALTNVLAGDLDLIYNDPANHDYLVWSELTVRRSDDSILSQEFTQLDDNEAPLVVLVPVFEVPGTIGIDGGAEAPLPGPSYFGISSPDTDADPLAETVPTGEDVTFQAILWVPASILSSADLGAFVDNATPPGIDLQINWYIDQDGVAPYEKDLALPPSTITYHEVETSGPLGVPNRVGVKSEITLENVQNDDNNDANGAFFAEVVTPFGTYTTDGAVLTVTAP